ncbi:MAG: DUF1648 domain-containing protein [Lachnospiraceae bacterium]|jgi:uncharacterized membrane protein|nr:DUF1648 domain-containing protein [Lachnospiraceae bacterium]
MKTKKTVYYILMYLPFAVNLAALPFLPDRIPAHYGFDNQVTRWGSKYEALLYPLVIVFMGYFMLAMAKLGAKDEEHGKNNETVLLISGILILLLFHVLNAYSLYTSFVKAENLSSVPLDLNQLIFGITGVLMIVIGNVMPKLRMNSVVGLRTHWSMKNEVTWKKCQRMGGISFMAGGVIIIGIAVALKGIPCLLSALGILVLLGVVDVYLSFLIAKRN